MDRATRPSVPTMKVQPPGPRSREILKKQDRILFKGLRAAQAEAPFVTLRKWEHAIEDADGNVYLNLATGSGSMPLGPAPEGVIEPTIAAMRRFGNECSNFLASDVMPALAEKLVAVSPPHLTRVDMALNGTEAIEAALKFMRRSTGRPLILSFFGQYHGESTATVGAGAQTADGARGQRQLNPGFVHVPYPDPYRSPFAEPRFGGSGDATVDFIRDHVLFHQVDPTDVAGLLIEPIIGAGGVITPPDDFWPALVALCNEYGWLMCVDEVKSGMGRTGYMFSFERWEGVAPDLVCLGKALGGGVQSIGAVLGTEAVLGTFDDVTTGSTWSWTPAACVAAVHAIDRYLELLPRVRELEAIGRDELGDLPEKYDVVAEVRMKGVYWAIEFVRDRETKQRWPAFQRVVEDECMKRGVVAQTGESTYQMLPPYTIPFDDLRRGCRLVEESIVAAIEQIGDNS